MNPNPQTETFRGQELEVAAQAYIDLLKES